MPIRDRKFYINQYNVYMGEKQRAQEGGGGGSSMDIDAATDMAQNDLGL